MDNQSDIFPLADSLRSSRFFFLLPPSSFFFLAVFLEVLLPDPNFFLCDLVGAESLVPLFRC